MSYESCVSALLDQIRLIDGFDDTNTSIADYNIMNLNVEKFIVLNYAGFTRQPFTVTGPSQYVWDIHILLGALYVDDVTIHDILRDARQLVIDRIQQHPQLGDVNIFDSEISSGNPLGLSETGNFVLEEMICRIAEINQLTIQ